ncbi:MAG: Glutamate decarboxylase [Candidatus Anoxychlamydiales bacterium]|nr:Glutamate decarboxylase [Candidatus Anoxychlamydiales bacterium]
MVHKKVKLEDLKDAQKTITPLYARHALKKSVPKYEIPKEPMLPRTAYDLIHDELLLDGNSRFNLATFVSTWMEPEAKQLIMDTLDKNMIDKDEYPQTAEIENRCVNILSRLWNSPKDFDAMGCSTIGSSEACMLGGMALKWKWKEKMKKMNKPFDKPNLVMGMNVQVCWEKFCRYWDIEPRFVCSEGNRFIIDPKEAAKLADENTIGVVCIMGSTFDGSYEPVEKVSDELDKLEKEKGFDIPIHVDGASGGFIAPFLDPKLKWDFRINRVKSINTSGHKYGLVYPGVGWVIWRDKDELPEDLIFYVDYLGGKMATFAINFSRPGSQICAQYYNFLRLGFEGYKEIQQACRDTALYLSSAIEKMGPFKLITKGDDIPVFAWTLKEQTNFTLYDMADKLRERGWLVPAYKMPKNREDLTVQRIVVKNGFSIDMADMLLNDIKRNLEFFKKQKGFIKKEEGHHFRH